MFVIRSFFVVAFTLISFSGIEAQTKMSLKPLSSRPGSLSMYELKFTLSEPLVSNALTELQFPGKYNLSTVALASSNDIKGGFTIQVNGDKLIIKRSGLGPDVKAQKELKIILGPLKVPTENQSVDDKILIGIKANGSKEYQVSQELIINRK